MPTYVYHCSKCDKTFEAFQPITADALTECECGGVVKRVIQPVAVAFKGSGFHINDYAVSTSETKSTSESAVDPSPAESKPASSPPETPPTPVPSPEL